MRVWHRLKGAMELLRNQKMDKLGAKDDAEEKATSEATSTGGEKCPHLWSKRWLAVKNVDHAQLGLIQAAHPAPNPNPNPNPSTSPNPNPHPHPHPHLNPNPNPNPHPFIETPHL